MALSVCGSWGLLSDLSDSTQGVIHPVSIPLLNGESEVSIFRMCQVGSLPAENAAVDVASEYLVIDTKRSHRASLCLSHHVTAQANADHSWPTIPNVGPGAFLLPGGPIRSMRAWRTWLSLAWSESHRCSLISFRVTRCPSPSMHPPACSNFPTHRQVWKVSFPTVF